MNKITKRTLISHKRGIIMTKAVAVIAIVVVLAAAIGATAIYLNQPPSPSPSPSATPSNSASPSTSVPPQTASPTNSLSPSPTASSPGNSPSPSATQPTSLPSPTTTPPQPSQTPPVTSPATTTPPPTQITPTPTQTTPTPPPPTPTPPTTPVTTTFDFDSNTPTLFTGENTPINQTSSGVTARFSSPSDPAFSIQSRTTTFYPLTLFPGKYLLQNSIVRVSLDIKFNVPVKNISLTFATNDSHGAGNVNNATDIKLAAYMGSTATSPVGTASARGTFTSESFAEGTISFTSAQSFDLVRLELAVVSGGATAFIVDNITITTA